MNELYPLKFKPVFKEKIWGGQQIKTRLGMDFSPLPNCGEAWILSGYGDDISEVSNGFLEGNALDELIEVYMGDLIGEEVYEKHGTRFPMLIKILDTTDWLSVQVHPDDEKAQLSGEENGKTEMWYISSAAADSAIINGLKKGTTSEKLEKAVAGNDLLNILNKQPVKGGDVFHLEAGIVHALGPDIMLYEIQQSSDTTYRFYDFDRTDNNGNKRELHISEAINAVNFEKPLAEPVEYERTINKSVPLVHCNYFNTNIMHFGTQVVKDYSGIDSFVLLLCTEGECRIESGHTEILKPGEIILIPAVTETVTITPVKNSTLLEITYPLNS